MKQTILVIEDEAAIRSLLQFSLQADGFTPVLCEDAKPALQVFNHQLPDLILLDWMLPSMSGIDFLKKIKKNAQTKHIPVIMLTAKAEESNKIKGLEQGADDYVTKPFSPKELTARIKSVLRRGLIKMPNDCIDLDKLSIDTHKKQATLNGNLLKLTPNSYRLLEFFATHSNRTYSRSELLDYVWGRDKHLDERSVDAEIKRLRKTLGNYSKLIKTLRGSGYQFAIEKNHER